MAQLSQTLKFKPDVGNVRNEDVQKNLLARLHLTIFTTHMFRMLDCGSMNLRLLENDLDILQNKTVFIVESLRIERQVIEKRMGNMFIMELTEWTIREDIQTTIQFRVVSSAT